MPEGSITGIKMKQNMKNVRGNMEQIRMSNADMIQYCDEALAWDGFGPIDTLFFETVKRIITGEISPMEEDTFQETIFDEEGFFNETETSGDYYNPDPEGSIVF